MPENNHGAKSNEEALMKAKPISILRLASVAIATSALCFVGNAQAQLNTSTSDNPHLRAKNAPPQAAAAAVKLSDKDKKFLLEAAAGGRAEVADGKVAEERGGSADVKRIAAHMVTDHSRANKELVELAKKKGLGINTDNGKPRDMGKANFDKQYLYSMEQDHQADIKVFEREASSGDDADIKAWAAKTLPTLKSHLAMVKDARKKEK
jgi:putative membrane protein